MISALFAGRLVLYVVWLIWDVISLAALFLGRFSTRATRARKQSSNCLSFIFGYIAMVIVAPEIAFAHPLRRDTAHWKTRPFSRAALFSSKLILLILLAFVIPLIVRTITHWSVGILPVLLRSPYDGVVVGIFVCGPFVVGAGQLHGSVAEAGLR